MVAARKNNPEDSLESKVEILCDSTSRVDERVKMLLENQEKLDAKFEKIIDKHISIQTKMLIIEERMTKIVESIEDTTDRMNEVEKKQNDLYQFKVGTEFHFKNIFSLAYNIGLSVAVGYILYRMGWQK
jgi:predicted nuclease with TOPRIM domain